MIHKNPKRGLKKSAGGEEESGGRAVERIA